MDWQLLYKEGKKRCVEDKLRGDSTRWQASTFRLPQFSGKFGMCGSCPHLHSQIEHSCPLVLLRRQLGVSQHSARY